MFVIITQFPSIPPEKEEQFRQWFKQSNEQYAKYPGFISRRLLKPRTQGNYTAIIEHESYETFIAMHSSPDQAKAKEKLETMIEGDPKMQFFEQVEGLIKDQVRG